MKKLFVIHSPNEGFWSNEQGWVYRSCDATLFTEEEKAKFPMLPLTRFGTWSEWVIAGYEDE